ncbi:hypothetical protein COO60DRAFT_1508776 [Scenedesmus sp. NREL 46B-D3]|nr:hypothetical protein COO60DRAFT_1508776 [Scenedesmus sp. NREL 46B-D3]
MKRCNQSVCCVQDTRFLFIVLLLSAFSSSPSCALHAVAGNFLCCSACRVFVWWWWVRLCSYQYDLDSTIGEWL